MRRGSNVFVDKPESSQQLKLRARKYKIFERDNAAPLLCFATRSTIPAINYLPVILPISGKAIQPRVSRICSAVLRLSADPFSDAYDDGQRGKRILARYKRLKLVFVCVIQGAIFKRDHHSFTRKKLLGQSYTLFEIFF